LALLPSRVAWPPHYCGAGGLLHHRFTLAIDMAVCFCGPIWQVLPQGESPPRTLSGDVLYGVRTFLDTETSAATIWLA